MTDSSKKTWVWVSWKDIKNPQAGGAELVHQEISKRLVKNGDRVVHLVPGFADCTKKETIDGIEIHRVGNNILYFYFIWFVFIKEYLKNTDYLVDVFNCFGSFVLFFGKLNKNLKSVFFIHHIQDKMWFYQTVFPGVPNFLMPLINFFGFWIEKIQLYLISIFQKKVFTVSKSTQLELCKYGFKKENIKIITEGSNQPFLDKTKWQKTNDCFDVVLIGPRKSKRPEETVKAFAIFAKNLLKTDTKAKLGLKVVGWGTEIPNLKELVKELEISNLVDFVGKVSHQARDEILAKSHVLCTTPVKEGWGLIVIEANRMATPVIGYNVAGIRDALAFDNGFLVAENPQAMADKLIEVYKMFKNEPEKYQKLQKICIESTKNLNFDQSYQDFIKNI